MFGLAIALSESCPLSKWVLMLIPGGLSTDTWN